METVEYLNLYITPKGQNLESFDKNLGVIINRIKNYHLSEDPNAKYTHWDIAIGLSVNTATKYPNHRLWVELAKHIGVKLKYQQVFHEGLRYPGYVKSIRVIGEEGRVILFRHIFETIYESIIANRVLTKSSTQIHVLCSKLLNKLLLSATFTTAKSPKYYPRVKRLEAYILEFYPLTSKSYIYKFAERPYKNYIYRKWTENGMAN